MAKVVSAHSLQRSWTYRNRSRVSGFVVLSAWAYVALTRPWIPQGSALDWIVDAAAWLAFLGGAALRLWATLWIAGRKKNKLVDDGPYRACRNPLYLGTFAMGIGLALFLKSLVFTGALGLLMLLYVWYVVPAEERYMPIQCADDYEVTVREFRDGFRGSASSAATRFFADPKTRRRSTANAGEWPAGCCWRRWPS